MFGSPTPHSKVRQATMGPVHPASLPPEQARPSARRLAVTLAIVVIVGAACSSVAAPTVEE